MIDLNQSRKKLFASHTKGGCRFRGAIRCDAALALLARVFKLNITAQDLVQFAGHSSYQLVSSGEFDHVRMIGVDLKNALIV
jgi:hypothetical protein